MASSRVFQFAVKDDSLSPDQASHVEGIGREFCQSMADKYTRGQKEHGGNLWEKSEEFLITAAIEEAIDQITYLLTLRDRMRKRSEYRDQRPR